MAPSGRIVDFMPETTPPSESGSSKRMVCDLTLGTEVSDLFIIASAQQGQARNGPYWRLDFRDASGSIGGKLWSPMSQNFAELSAGMTAHVSGKVTSYRDKLELSIDAMRILTEEESGRLDISLFMPASPYSPDGMMRELLDLAREVLCHPSWFRLVSAILTDPEIGRALRQAPAAKSMHHAYAGGLLEHTLSVVRVCMRLADHYPALDRQVLFAGAVCHDLGKLWELSHGLAVEYTQAGKLLGHISLFMDRLGPFIKESGLEPSLAEHLQHLVLSHHGSYEFGSPRLPATAEALVLHYADILDAKMQQVSTALSNLEEEQWTPYLPSLERSLFKARKTPEDIADQQESPNAPMTGEFPPQGETVEFLYRADEKILLQSSGNDSPSFSRVDDVSLKGKPSMQELKSAATEEDTQQLREPGENTVADSVQTAPALCPGEFSPPENNTLSEIKAGQDQPSAPETPLSGENDHGELAPPTPTDANTSLLPKEVPTPEVKAGTGRSKGPQPLPLLSQCSLLLKE